MNYRFSCIFAIFCFLAFSQTLQANVTFSLKNKTSYDMNIQFNGTCVRLDHFSINPSANPTHFPVNGKLRRGATAHITVSYLYNYPDYCQVADHYGYITPMFKDRHGKIYAPNIFFLFYSSREQEVRGQDGLWMKLIGHNDKTNTYYFEFHSY